MAADSVQFRHRFTADGQETDRVEEICFEQPVYLTGFQVEGLRDTAASTRLRLYAEDAFALATARYVPLFDGSLECKENAKQQFDVPKTASARVLLRGRFNAVEFALLGRSYVTSREEKTEQRQEFELAGREVLKGPYQVNGAGLPFVKGFPASLTAIVAKLAKGLDLKKEDRQRIFEEADGLCVLLGLARTNSLDRMIEDDVTDLTSEEWGRSVEAVSTGIRRLWVDGNSGHKNAASVETGMCCLATACVLCSCRTSVLHFVMRGGLTALVGIFKLRSATALMTRYVVCAVELISLTAGPLGCEALLGLLQSGRKQSQSEKTDANILHVPGIVSAKLSKETVKSHRKSTTSSVSLPPGMISPRKKAAEEDLSRRKGREEQTTDVDMSPEETEDHGKKRSSTKKKEKKKRKNKHKALRDRSPDHHDSRWRGEEKEARKHGSHRHSSTERASKRGSRAKEKAAFNGRSARAKEAQNQAADKKMELPGPSVKRQKCDHPPGEGSPYIDLRKCEGDVLPSTVSMYDLLFEILLQPRPQGIIQSIKRLLDRLNFYHCLFGFQEATHGLAAAGLSDSEPCLPFSDMSGVFSSSIAPCLERILTFVKDSMKKRTDMGTDNDDTEYSKGARCTAYWTVKPSFLTTPPDASDGNVCDPACVAGLWKGAQSTETDPCFLEYLSAMDFFKKMKAVIAAMQLEKEEKKWNAVRCQILKTASQLLVCLTETAHGLGFLQHHGWLVCGLGVDVGGQGDLVEMAVQSFQRAMGYVRAVLKCSQSMECILSGSMDCGPALRHLSECAKDFNLHEALLCALTVNTGLFAKLTHLSMQRNMSVLSSKEPRDWPYLIPLMLDLSKLAWRPAMLREIHQHSQLLKKCIEAAKERQTKGDLARSSASLVDEFLGRLEAVQLATDKGHGALLKELSSLLPKLVKEEEGKRKEFVSESEAVALLKDPALYGRVSMLLDILSSAMHRELDLMSAAELYGFHLMQILDCGLKSAIKVFEVASADALSTVMTGDSKNDLHVSKGTAQATEFLCAVLRCLTTALRCLHLSGLTVKATGCVKGLIQAYGLTCLSPENMTVILGNAPKPSALLQAKREILSVLQLLLESGMVSTVLDAVFSLQHPAYHLSEPVQIFTASCLLGDLFKDEWPPLPATSKKRGFLAVPSNMTLRASLARSASNPWPSGDEVHLFRGLEVHAVAFRYLIEFGIGSESHIVRGMTARLCARSAGLGGGMGLFLVEPIISEISSLIKKSGSASDYYRIAEALSALVPWPALKAAFLDAKLTSSVSRLLHGIAPDCSKDPSLLAICSVFLDIFTMLLDSEVAVDPFESLETRLHSDCPSPSELGVMVAALFANLHHFTTLQTKVLALLQSTVSISEGPAILVRGISRWRTVHVTLEGSNELTPKALVEWAVQKLTSAGKTPAETESVVHYLQGMSLEPDEPKESAPADRQLASARFKDTVQKAQETAPAVQLPELQDVVDRPLQIFWKFVHSFPPYQLKKTWTKWSCTGVESAPPSQYYLRQSFLTAPCRSREVLVQPQTYRPSRDQSEAGSVGTSTGIRPYSDLPPVMAPPRRGQETRKIKTASSGSRPPSVHVDDYCKSAQEETSHPRVMPEKLLPVKQGGVSVDGSVGTNGGTPSFSSGQGLRISPMKREVQTPQERPHQLQINDQQKGRGSVSIPGIAPTVHTDASMIPGIGPPQPITAGRNRAFNRDTRTRPRSSTGATSEIKNREGDSDNSPVAPQLSQSSAEDVDRAAPLPAMSNKLI